MAKKKITEGKIKTALVSTLTLMSLAGTYICIHSFLQLNWVKINIFQNFSEISNCVSFFKLFIWLLISCVYFDPYSYITTGINLVLKTSFWCMNFKSTKLGYIIITLGNICRKLASVLSETDMKEIKFSGHERIRYM